MGSELVGIHRALRLKCGSIGRIFITFIIEQVIIYSPVQELIYRWSAHVNLSAVTKKLILGGVSRRLAEGLVARIEIPNIVIEIPAPLYFCTYVIFKLRNGAHPLANAKIAHEINIWWEISAQTLEINTRSPSIASQIRSSQLTGR